MPTSWHEHWYTKTPNGGTEERKTPTTRHIPRGRSHQTPTRYFVILPFKECFLSNFTSLHSQLPEYVHTECPCIFNFSPLCIFVKNAPVLTFSSLNLNLAEDQIVFGTIGKRVVKIKTPSQMDVALWVVWLDGMYISRWGKIQRTFTVLIITENLCHPGGCSWQHKCLIRM